MLVYTLALTACGRDHPRAAPRSIPDAGVAEGLAGRVARGLRASLPGLNVRILNPQTVAAARPDAGATVISLDNLRRACDAEPTRCDEFVDREIRVVHEALEPPAVDRSALRAVVRDRRFVRQALSQLGGAADAGSDGLLFRPLVGDLVVAYVIDRADSMVMVTASTARDLGLTPTTISTRSRCRTASAYLPDIPYAPLAPGSAVFAVQSGDSYESSRLLFPERWEPIRHVVHGDLLVSVPIRDAILFTGSQEPNGLGALRAATQRLEEQHDHRSRGRSFDGRPAVGRF